MSDAGPVDPPVVAVNGPLCRNLRHNGMYVNTDGSGGDTSDDDDQDGHMYWCLKTMKGFGPDDDVAAARYCRRADRTCYEPS